MTEKTEDKADQEPAPTKESDANRVTAEESERAEKGGGPESEEDSASSDR